MGAASARDPAGRTEGSVYHAWMELSGIGVFDVGLVLLLAAGAGWLARRIHLPAVVGYLATGLVISPFTPGYVADREQLAFLADLGVVLLLFEVGMEIDVRQLHRQHGAVAWAAPVQIVLTTVLATGALVAFGHPLGGAALVGLGVSMSSTVVVVNITRSRRRTTSPTTEDVLLRWSLFQDLSGVALAAVLLALVGTADRSPTEMLGGSILFGLVAVAAAALLPRALRRLEPEPDLFLVVSVAVGLALAGFGALVAGVPVALAAFIAGLAISDGPEAEEVRRRLLPFRDLLAVFFFVLLGTLIDPAVVSGGLAELALVAGSLIGAKIVVIALLARLARVEADARQLAIGLGQLGEFSFVLASAGAALGVVTAELYTAVIGIVVLSIAGSTIVVRLVGRDRPMDGPSMETGAR